jgi:hypothetical protein
MRNCSRKMGLDCIHTLTGCASKVRRRAGKGESGPDDSRYGKVHLHIVNS